MTVPGIAFDTIHLSIFSQLLSLHQYSLRLYILSLKREMLLCFVQPTFTSSSQSTPYSNFNTLDPTTLLPKTFLPGFGINPTKTLVYLRSRAPTISTRASLLEAPVLWAGRICGFYALLKAGLAGSPSSPLVSDLKGIGNGDGAGPTAGDLGFSKWLENFQRNPEKEAADKRKLLSKWHPTTKGTLRRNYRVPSKTEGRRLLKAIASLLSDDDHFIDATSHKGCQIRRESAHGESVCCNNVRALFDELPTPHLIVEITAFPAGPLTERDYVKAEKLEKVLRSSPSV